MRVPVENRIGEEGKGWTYAKFLLGNERVGVADIGKFERYLLSLRQLLGETKEGGHPLSEEPEFKKKVADLEVTLETIKALEAAQLAAARRDGSPSLMGAAALKLRGSEFQQSALQAIMDVFGRHGMVYQLDALHPGWNGDQVGPDEMAGLIYEHLYRRAATIYGGSSEVQKNIIGGSFRARTTRCPHLEPKKGNSCTTVCRVTSRANIPSSTFGSFQTRSTPTASIARPGSNTPS